MEDKVFELLEKMYEEMQEGFIKNDKKITDLEKKMEHKFIDLENKVEQNITVLHDGYKQTYEKLTSIENKIENLSNKVEKQDVEIRVVKNIASK